MTDYKKGAILGSILGGLVYFPLFIFYFPLIFSPLIFFLGMFLGAFLGLLFSKLYDFLQSKWKSTGLMHLFVFLFFFVSDLVINEKLVHYGLYGLVSSSGLALIPTVILLPWTVPMFYFWDREWIKSINGSDGVHNSDEGSGYWLPLFVGFVCSMIIFAWNYPYVFYTQCFLEFGCKHGTHLLFFLALAIGAVFSIASSYLIYRKKEKQFNLEVLIYGGIIFLLAFSIFSGGMYQAGIFTRGGNGPQDLLQIFWDEKVCDAGMNVINSTVSNGGSKIPTDGGGTFLVKRDGRIVCEKNLSATDIGGGGLEEDDVWNRGERVSYDFNLNSSPYCDSGMTIESNQDYTLELKIIERFRDTIKATCTGKHY